MPQSISTSPINTNSTLTLADESVLATTYARLFNSFNNPKSSITLRHTANGSLATDTYTVGSYSAEAEGPFLKIITLRPQTKFPKLRYYSYYRASNLLSISGQGLVP